ncbi:hypothetical protein RCM89_15810 [Escherichia marmotae]|nr:hypothetical protein [Escherichia marmotae]MEC9837826.1 hypothetical protein [Escherichia marmotae]MEC9848405.1 hypothetical protein [Escherichia marmotae]MEC9937475.1 hypothetical protein [Escherichia marmotae]MED9243376.1 hypothetical protein [Escherichia marmotae]
MMPNRRPDKALAPHPALLPNSSTAVMSDAMLTHLIRPTVTDEYLETRFIKPTRELITQVIHHFCWH